MCCVYDPTKHLSWNGESYYFVGPHLGKLNEVDEQHYREMQRVLDDFHAGKGSNPHYEQDVVTYIGFQAWQAKEARVNQYEASLENPEAYPHIWQRRRM